MDLTDERFHRKRVPWKALKREGIEPRQVLVEAQKKGLWKLATSAKHRIDNEKRGIFK